MSDWGGGRFGGVRATSALPLIADIRCEDQQVRKVPAPDIDPAIQLFRQHAPALPSYLEAQRLGGLEFITSSNPVGCSIGRSAGLAPLRILLTK